MSKYTERPIECPKERCGKRNYFLITVVKTPDGCFYITQCPRCKSYDDVRRLTEDEFNLYKPKK